MIHHLYIMNFRCKKRLGILIICHTCIFKPRPPVVRKIVGLICNNNLVCRGRGSNPQLSVPWADAEKTNSILSLIELKPDKFGLILSQVRKSSFCLINWPTLGSQQKNVIHLMKLAVVHVCPAFSVSPPAPLDLELDL